MKLRLPQRRIWRIAIYLASLLLILIALDMVLVQVRRTIHPGYDTTRIIAPLQPDGSIDYLIAIEEAFSEGITPQNNAAALVLRALGRQALPSNQPPDGITDRLGMPHLPEEGDYFIQYEDYRKQHSVEGEEPGPIDLSEPSSWPVKVDQFAVQWIRDNEKPMALITDATKRGRFFMPFYGGHRTETLLETLLLYVHPIREAGLALRLRALIRLQEGNIAGFREDILSAHRLARLLGQQPTMIDRMVAMMMETATCQAARLGAAHATIPADELRAMVRELATMGELPSFDESVNITERFLILDTLQVMARAGPVRAGQLLNLVGPSGHAPSPALFPFLPLNYERSMRQMNRIYDGALAAMSQPTYPQRAAALKLWQQQGQKSSGSPSLFNLLFRDWPARVFAPDLLAAQQREDTARTERRLTLVALALAAFKAEHGAYPATLDELSPAYLQIVPNDLFSEKPLIYSRSGDGYVLYSAGPNMTDDGGKIDKPGDDIVASQL